MVLDIRFYDIMPKYYVASGPAKGGMEEIVIAEDPVLAAIAAVQRRNWETLGVVMLISEAGFAGNRDEDLWILSTRVVSKAGMEYHIDQDIADALFEEFGMETDDPENPKDF
jgi:hypothetical protein